MRKTARSVVWEGWRAKSRQPDPIEENGQTMPSAGADGIRLTAPGAHPGEGVFPSSGQGGINGQAAVLDYLVSQAAARRVARKL